MSDPYRKVNAGRLTFKGGDLATRSKSIDKKNKKKKKKQFKSSNDVVLDEAAIVVEAEEENSTAAVTGGGAEIYTIDAAKKMKYDELFPVEAKRFGYEPKSKEEVKSVEEALDDRVKKKADRYCK